ncbi:MAG: NADP-dependent oxidoreductase [Hydrogenophaga sp.]|nr:NADP-dependent oxidoreductase [Hydrogenophaga sp.]
MRAIWYEAYGPPSVLRWGEQALPEPGNGQVRVRLQASALAQLDVKLRAGLLQAHFALTLPKIPGRDGVGVIDAVGDGVANWRLGDEVCVLAAPLGAGTAASHVVTEAARVVARPQGLSLEQSAALLQPGASAWAAVTTAQLQPGMRVLVHGGSGAVGALVLQHARGLGVRTVATCRHDHRDHTLAQGADEVIAYDRGSFGHLRGLDVVFDFVGGDTHARSYPLLRPGGAIVYLVAAPFEDRGAEHGVRVLRALVTDAPGVLRGIAHVAREGFYRPLVSRCLPLREAALGHTLLEAGQVRLGRVVFAHG